MGSKERREREKDETRQKIEDAARELFATHGYEGVSMRKIAEKIEYSATTIYQHFKDKETLIKALCYADFRRLAETFQGLLKIKDPLERIRKCGVAYIQFGIEYPNHYRLMFMTPYPTPEGQIDCEFEAVRGNPELDAYAFLQFLVQDAIKAGITRDPRPDADLITQTLWAGVHGLVALEITLGTDNWLQWRTLKQRSAAMMDALLQGIFEEKKPCRR